MKFLLSFFIIVMFLSTPILASEITNQFKGDSFNTQYYEYYFRECSSAGGVVVCDWVSRLERTDEIKTFADYEYIDGVGWNGTGFTQENTTRDNKYSFSWDDGWYEDPYICTQILRTDIICENGSCEQCSSREYLDGCSDPGVTYGDCRPKYVPSYSGSSGFYSPATHGFINLNSELVRQTTLLCDSEVEQIVSSINANEFKESCPNHAGLCVATYKEFDGYGYQIDGVCSNCNNGFIWNDNLQTCVDSFCPEGFDACGVCGGTVLDPQQCVDMTCPENQVWNESLQQCVDVTCPENQVWNESLQQCVDMTCPENQVWNESLQQCVDVTCPENQVWNESLQQCVDMTCPDGFTKVGDQCLPNTCSCQGTAPQGIGYILGESEYICAGEDSFVPIINISSTTAAFAALKSDGSVMTWGSPGHGGNSSSVSDKLQENVTAIFSNDYAFAALKSDGSVVTWGSPGYGGKPSLSVSASLQSGVQNIHSTERLFAAVKEDKSVITWDLSSGVKYSIYEIENGGVISGSSNPVTKIFSNDYAFAAVRENGSVVTWGFYEPYQKYYNASSLLNDPNNEPISFLNTNNVFVALKDDGSVVTWGSEYLGRQDLYIDVPDLQKDVFEIYTTDSAYAALKNDGSVVTWGFIVRGGNSSSVSDKLQENVTTIFSTTAAFAALKNNGSVVTWGVNTDGGNSSSVSDKLQENVTTIFSTTAAFAALKSDGSVVTWGRSDRGGNSSSVLDRLQENVTVIFSNDYAFAALKSDGSVVTWGRSNRGGNSSSVSDKLQENVTTIFSNDYAFTALKSDGRIVTWGDENYGGNSDLEETIFWYFTSDFNTDACTFTCADGYIWNESLQQCVDVTCPDGFTKVGDQCLPNTCGDGVVHEYVNQVCDFGEGRNNGLYFSLTNDTYTEPSPLAYGNQTQTLYACDACQQINETEIPAAHCGDEIIQYWADEECDGEYFCDNNCQIKDEYRPPTSCTVSQIECEVNNEWGSCSQAQYNTMISGVRVQVDTNGPIQLIRAGLRDDSLQLAVFEFSQIHFTDDWYVLDNTNVWINRSGPYEIQTTCDTVQNVCMQTVPSDPFNWILPYGTYFNQTGDELFTRVDSACCGIGEEPQNVELVYEEVEP